MFIPAGFTTETHNITAYYALLIGGLPLAAIPVDTNGNDLQEITADLLDFFNDSEETARTFRTFGVVHVGDDAKVELRGAFYKQDNEGEYINDTVTVKVIIVAYEK